MFARCLTKWLDLGQDEEKKRLKRDRKVHIPTLYPLHFLRSPGWEFQIPVASKTSMPPCPLCEMAEISGGPKAMKVEAAGMGVVAQNLWRHLRSEPHRTFPCAGPRSEQSSVSSVRLGHSHVALFSVETTVTFVSLQTRLV
jgi:hypothetical protein